MTDFTFSAYREYLEIIKCRYTSILTFSKILSAGSMPERFCLIRHDVDRKPENARRMGQLEHSLGIRATYYFRTRPHTLVPGVIKELSGLGHEIGYHYECLSDAKGNETLAIETFRKELGRLREICEIKTAAMHGAPLSPFDNRDLFKNPANHEVLAHELDMLGEVYLDVDYSDIAYISDTGRNWSVDRANCRDLVNSNIKLACRDGKELKKKLKSGTLSRIVFQVHPERWHSSPAGFVLQAGKDYITNMAKCFLDWKNRRR